MGSTIRQFENAIGLLVNGALRDDDSTETVRQCVAAMLRAASDWAENLNDESVGKIWEAYEYVRDLTPDDAMPESVADTMPDA